MLNVNIEFFIFCYKNELDNWFPSIHPSTHFSPSSPSDCFALTTMCIIPFIHPSLLLTGCCDGWFVVGWVQFGCGKRCYSLWPLLLLPSCWESSSTRGMVLLFQFEQHCFFYIFASVLVSFLSIMRKLCWQFMDNCELPVFLQSGFWSHGNSVTSMR